MLIQNVNTMTQASQPAGRADNGAPEVAVATVSNVQPSAGVSSGPPTEAQKKAEPVSTAQLQGVVESINRALKQSNKNLEFTIDNETSKSIVKLVDSETGDVIRQFPSEEALAISRAIDRMQQGMLLKQEA